MTPIYDKPLSRTLPTLALAGAIFGFFIDAGLGTTFFAVPVVALICAGLAYVALNVMPKQREREMRWASIILFAVGGFLAGGLSGLIVAGLFGWFLGWFIYWIGRGRYRGPLPRACVRRATPGSPRFSTKPTVRSAFD